MPVFDLGGHGDKRLFDIGRILGRRLQEGNIQLIGKILFAQSAKSFDIPSCLGNLVLDNLLLHQIALVAHQELVDALGGITIDFLQPLLDVIERFHVRHIVDDDNPVRATIVRRRNGSETLLTRRVPLRSEMDAVGTVRFGV